MSALRSAFFILYLESCISRLNVIPCHDLTPSVSEPDNAAAKQGQELRSEQPVISLHEQRPSTYFCVLTIRKHLPKVDFERSGRGQEPSRGHKFSILENFLSIRDFTSAMRPHFRSDLVGACLPQTLLRTDEEELCQFDAIPPTYREKQSVPDGERPIVHIAIVCGLWQGASYSGTHPVFILSLHRLFEIPPSASRIRIVSRF